MRVDVCVCVYVMTFFLFNRDMTMTYHSSVIGVTTLLSRAGHTLHPILLTWSGAFSAPKSALVLGSSDKSTISFYFLAVPLFWTTVSIKRVVFPGTRSASVLADKSTIAFRYEAVSIENCEVFCSHISFLFSRWYAMKRPLQWAIYGGIVAHTAS